MAALAAAIAAGALGAWQMNEAKQQRKGMENEARKIKAEQDKATKAREKQLAEAKAQTETEEDRLSAVQERKRKVARQLAGRSQAFKKGGTVLTGPGEEEAGKTLGQTGKAKTILGA